MASDGRTHYTSNLKASAGRTNFRPHSGQIQESSGYDHYVGKDLTGLVEDETERSYSEDSIPIRVHAQSLVTLDASPYYTRWNRAIADMGSIKGRRLVVPRDGGNVIISSPFHSPPRLEDPIRVFQRSTLERDLVLLSVHAQTHTRASRAQSHKRRPHREHRNKAPTTHHTPHTTNTHTQHLE